MTPHEETIVLEARDILGRYLSQNPVIGSWQALMDYSASADRSSVSTSSISTARTASSPMSFSRPARSTMSRSIRAR